MKNLTILITGSVYITTFGFGTTINVPTDYSTIQAGLNAASEGDTVLVATGTYVENITWPATNGIKLIGSSTEDCIIDGDSLASVIRFEGELGGIIDTSTHISGFTIQNGYAQGDWPYAFGGGIYCRTNSNPSLVNVTISSCSADSAGGGIYCNNSKPSLINVTISSNSSYFYGGGIYCNSNSNPSLENVTITNNSSGTGGGIHCKNSSPILVNVSISGNSVLWNGGGMFCVGNSNPSLVEVSIINNFATSGGGIFCYWDPSPTLENVMITGNSASDHGGGIYCCAYSNPSLTNVTMSGNSAGHGGGIYCYWYSSPSLENVTITGNSADNDGGGIFCRCSTNLSLVNCILWNDSPQEIYFDEDDDPNTIMISYSDIQGGEEAIVTNDNGTVYWEEGNIDADPLFVDSTDFHLQKGSPCIDAGTAFFVWGGDTLVDIPDSLYNGLAPDMGAFEYGTISTTHQSPLTPHQFALHHNYPNPFNPVTTICYDLPEKSNVTIVIYDILGRTVRQLVNSTQDAGYRSVIWDGTDSFGKSVSAGVYLYKIQTVEFSQVKKMILIK